MSAESFVEYLEINRSPLEAWGRFIASRVQSSLIESGHSPALIKIPVLPRVKDTASAVGKIGRKGYDNPIAQMTDLVGIRFVVLLTEDIQTLCSIISSEPSWKAEVSKDFLLEIENNTKIFDYQSKHYEIRPLEEFVADDIKISKDLCCEVQIRTLLQHAYAEMVHDNIYKPKGVVTTSAERHVARSMALIETTDDLFSRTIKLLADANAPRTEFSKDLDSMFREHVGGQYIAPDIKTSLLVIDAFGDVLESGLSREINELLKSKKYIPRKIKERASVKGLFSNSVILFVYWLALNTDSVTLKARWPLPGDWRSLNLVISDVNC
ncbi:GTP pyrophosphokinase [Pseudomonas lurida]|uniref:RelA/SpoT domain-containing protein n=1 Tax=Pseudomonas lurida TaxID=244566 RepID=A0ABY9FVA1_9PSED|nr:RelA/SpoT domain-containing protein [Pseudomonas lurida]WLH07246.1 RelA/SpoT domain-containing protein [Pseudomonas lurida]